MLADTGCIRTGVSRVRAWLARSLLRQVGWSNERFRTRGNRFTGPDQRGYRVIEDASEPLRPSIFGWPEVLRQFPAGYGRIERADLRLAAPPLTPATPERPYVDVRRVLSGAQLSKPRDQRTTEGATPIHTHLVLRAVSEGIDHGRKLDS